MTMIEKVAEAIAKQAGDDDKSDWDAHMGFARAAIEAMRLPDQAVLSAGTETMFEKPVGDYNYDMSLSEEEFSTLWAAVIDAALMEQ